MCIRDRLLRDPTSADRPNMPDVAPARIPATILVIDDDMSVQMLAAQVLRNEGYHVLVASDMDEALRVSGEYAPDIDLVLTDIVLPTGNGMTLARALQRTRPNTPVLYLSLIHISEP